MYPKKEEKLNNIIRKFVHVSTENDVRWYNVFLNM